MKKVGCIGSATQDIFMLYEGAETLHLHTRSRDRSFMMLEQGTKVDIPSLHYATGGGATNAAASFKRLGFDVETFFKIGNDNAGRYIHEELERERIGIQHSIIDTQTATAISFIVPSMEHNHVALCYRGENTMLALENFPIAVMQSLDHLYISPLSDHSGLLLPAIATKAQELGKPVAHNPSITQLVHDTAVFLSALHAINILIVNTYEATHLIKGLLKEDPQCADRFKQPTKGQPSTPPLLNHFMAFNNTRISLYEYATEILSRGPSIAIVTDGARGVYVATPESIYFHPSIKTETAYGLGAGDAFGSTFVGALALGKSLEEAIVYGVINASSVIHYPDAKQGLLTLADLEKRAAIIETSKLQKFSR